jgi:phosphoenolpyruvate carboxylase
VILGAVRDKLYNTRERARHLLATGFSEISVDSVFTNIEEVNKLKCDLRDQSII